MVVVIIVVTRPSRPGTTVTYSCKMHMQFSDSPSLRFSESLLVVSIILFLLLSRALHIHVINPIPFAMRGLFTNRPSWGREGKKKDEIT